MLDLKNLLQNKIFHFVHQKARCLAVQNMLHLFLPFPDYKYVNLAEDHRGHNVNKENYPGH